jgi:hemin uptake protein HemP
MIIIYNQNRNKLGKSEVKNTHSDSGAKLSNASGRIRRTTSEALLGEGQVLVIMHHDQEYQLRHTKNGKLILTK